MENSFDISDAYYAKQAFAAWQAKDAQELEDYIIRQRKAELNELVRQVIQNELCQQDRLLVDLHWYKGFSKEEIAKMTEMSRSAVYRRFEKINGIIYASLKYAIQYRYGTENEKSAKVLLKQSTVCPGDCFSLTEAGKRLFQLRESQFLTRREVGDKTGIGEKRLGEIEKNGRNATMLEIKKLASFYKVSSDYIIFGKQRTIRDPLTGMPENINC
ncbi:MAG: helix-turn-helix domain-containing protein [Acutalibacteraceae bacterium]